jgi:hypothetical protein
MDGLDERVRGGIGASSSTFAAMFTLGQPVTDTRKANAARPETGDAADRSDDRGKSEKKRAKEERRRKKKREEGGERRQVNLKWTMPWWTCPLVKHQRDKEKRRNVMNLRHPMDTHRIPNPPVLAGSRSFRRKGGKRAIRIKNLRSTADPKNKRT